MKKILFTAVLTALVILAVGFQPNCKGYVDCSVCFSLETCYTILQCQCCNFCQSVANYSYWNVHRYLPFPIFPYLPVSAKCGNKECQHSATIMKWYQPMRSYSVTPIPFGWYNRIISIFR